MLNWNFPLSDWMQFAVYFAVLLALVKPLGLYMARVAGGERTFMSPVFGPVERGFYRLSGLDPQRDMPWAHDAAALLWFSLGGLPIIPPVANVLYRNFAYWRLKRLQHRQLVNRKEEDIK